VFASCWVAWGGRARISARLEGTFTAAAVIARLSFCQSVELPAIPPRPVLRHDAAATVAAAAVATAAIERDPAEYAARLASDSRALHIEPPVTPADLSLILPYRSEPAQLVLEPRRKRDTAELLGLALSVSVEKAEGAPHRQLVLEITNTTHDHLAYRVLTRPSTGVQSCYGKSDIAHNAIALAPREKARRSECIYRKGSRLYVDRVETIRLPRLSYYYVSALPQAALGLDRFDRLAARGHRPVGARSPCRVFQSAELSAALASGAATWRDLMDFYARHPCGVYSFTINYKAFERDGERALPAVSPGP